MAKKRRNPAAVALGKRGAKQGGKARWEGVPREARSTEMARVVRARWSKAKKRVTS